VAAAFVAHAAARHAAQLLINEGNQPFEGVLSASFQLAQK
jgi:hypothetical protein